MIFYFSLFLVSSILFFLSEKIRGFFSYLLVALGVFLPCFFAAVRDLSIGTDLTVYGVYVYKATQNVSLFSAIESITDNPVGFVSLAWLINQFHGSFEIYLFIIEFLIVFPTYLVIHYFLKKDSWIGMFLFYLFFYAVSLNIMKQMIAVSLSALALVLHIRRRHKTGLFVSVIAFLIHQTGFVSFLLYPMYLLFKKVTRYSLFRRIAAYVITGICISCVFIFGDTILGTLSEVKESYSYMVRNKGNGGVVLAPLLYLIIVLIYKFIAFYIEEKNHSMFTEDIVIFPFIEYLSICGLLLLQMQLITLGLARFGYYFEFYLPIYIGLAFQENSRKILRFLMILLVFCVIFFQSKFVLDGNCEVYPYKSLILHIN